MGVDRGAAVKIGGSFRNEDAAHTWSLLWGGARPHLEARQTLSLSDGGFSIGGEVAAVVPHASAPEWRDYNVGLEYRQPSYVMSAGTLDRMRQGQLSVWHRMPLTLAGTTEVGADVRVALDHPHPAPVVAVAARVKSWDSSAASMRLDSAGSLGAALRIAGHNASLQCTATCQPLGPLPAGNPQIGLALSFGDP